MTPGQKARDSPPVKRWSLSRIAGNKAKQAQLAKEMASHLRLWRGKWEKNLASQSSLDEAYTQLIEGVMEVVERVVGSKELKASHKTWWNRELSSLRRKRRALCMTVQKDQGPEGG